MAEKLKGPVIPTGYESLGRELSHRREVAKALQEAGMFGKVQPHALDLFGNLAQAWAGTSELKDISKDEQALDMQKLADYQLRSNLLKQSIDGGNLSEAAGIAQGSPYLQNSIMGQAVAKALETRMTNQQSGELVRMNTPDGPKTVVQDKTGGVRAGPQGFELFPEVSNINNVAIALRETAPGTVLPQPAMDPVVLGPDGKPMLNEPTAGYLIQKAQASRPVTTINSVFQNAEAKSFGDEIPKAVLDELTAGKSAAAAAMAGLPHLAKAKEALKSGMFTGWLAGTQLDLARMADAFGIGGRSQAEKIANTQSFMMSMGNQMFPILAALRPASDTDVKTAKAMTGGDITLSPKAIASAINAAYEEAPRAIERQRMRVNKVTQVYQDRPEISSRIKLFSVDDEQLGGPGQAAPGAASRKKSDLELIQEERRRRAARRGN